VLAHDDLTASLSENWKQQSDMDMLLIPFSALIAFFSSSLSSAENTVGVFLSGFR
jgi:hypothetical protein